MTERSIEECMMLAAEGSPEAVRQFYTLLLGCSVVVPERFQAKKLKETVTYPDSFLNLFAVKVNNEITVPAFTNPAFLQEWANGTITHRTLKSSELFALLPEHWTITVNPGQEVEKEISWWEIERLKFGTEGIDEVVAEVLQDAPLRSLEAGLATEEEFGQTITALKEAAIGLPDLSAVYLLKEVGRDLNDKEQISLMIGAVIDGHAKSKYDQIEETLRSAAGRTQIGGYPIKVFAGSSLESVALGPFQHFEPLFKRTKLGFWSRARKAIGL